MASGCPVIGSNVGGIPDIICDGENGFLVPERDPKMLGSRIVRVLSDESLQKKFRENGVRCVQDRFTWDTVAIQFLHLYSESCSTPPREESVYT